MTDSIVNRVLRSSIDMQLPQLTTERIRQRCTETSFNRGVEYFHAGTIGNPVLHGYSLSATCGGSNLEPYRLSVELMPTGIADTHCSCPYTGEGDCKHIVALLLTYVHAPETIYSVETLLSTLAENPASSLLQVISELLKRAPELVPIAQVYADIPQAPRPPANLALRHGLPATDRSHFWARFSGEPTTPPGVKATRNP